MMSLTYDCGQNICEPSIQITSTGAIFIFLVAFDPSLILIVI